jgi:hypothetical protein
VKLLAFYKWFKLGIYVKHFPKLRKILRFG